MAPIFIGGSMRYAIMNQKGGSGKTTLATHLASGLFVLGRRVLLIDADRQRSAVNWYQAGQSDGLTMPMVSRSTGEAVPKMLGQAVDNYDDVVVDTGGDLREDAQEEAVAIIKAVDVVLIPVRPSGFDLWGSRDVLYSLTQYRERFDTPKVGIVMTMTRGSTALTRQAREALTAYPFPVLTHPMALREAYAQQTAMGRTAFDLRRSNKARQESEALIQEIMTL